MNLVKIELKNFKVFRDQTFTFPEANDEKNIILIGGMNGYGKTSFLEAIYLGLYGYDAVGLLHRIVENKNNYASANKKQFFESLYSFNPTSNHMVINLDFVDDEHSYRISRTWIFEDRKFYNEKFSLDLIIDNKTYKIDDNNEIGAYIKQEIVDSQCAKFFFFDGEDVQNIATNKYDFSQKLESAFKGLLGFELLKFLSNDLEKVSKTNIVGTSSASLKGIQLKENTLEKHKASLIKLNASLKQLQDNKQKIDDKLLMISNDIKISGLKLIQPAGNETRFEKAIRDAMLKLNLIKKEIEKYSNENLPLMLVPTSLIKNFETRVEIEKKHKEELKKSELTKQIFVESSIESSESKKDKFFDMILDEDNQSEYQINPALIKEQKFAISLRLDKAWETLIEKFPKSIQNIKQEQFTVPEKITLLHGYLNEMTYYNVKHQLAKYSGKKETLSDLFKQKREQENKIAENEWLKKQFKEHHGKELEDKFLQQEQLQKELRTIEDSIRSQQHNKLSTEQEISSLNREIERDYQKIEKTKPAIVLDKKIQIVTQLIDRVHKEFIDPLRLEFAKSATDVYNELVHKKQNYTINITEKYECELFDENKQLININDRSSGEKQVFATAIIGGMGKLISRNIPLMIDTPLGRLDSQHRNNIVNFWVENKERQVFLLVQDTEIGSINQYPMIFNSLLKTYRLDFNKQENYSTAYENVSSIF